MNWRQLMRVILVPTAGQIGVSVLAACLLLSVIYGHALLDLIARGAGVTDQDISLGLHSQLQLFASQPLLGKLGIIGFWVIAGIALYFFTLFTSNAIVNLQNFVIVQTTYTSSQHWVTVVMNVLVRLVLIGAAITLVYITATVLVPWLTYWFGRVFTNLTPITILQSLASLAGLTVSLYIAWMVCISALSFRRS